MKYQPTIIALCLLFFSSVVTSATTDNGKINALKSTLSHNATQQEKLQNELKTAETKIGSLSNSMTKTAHDITSGKQRLNKLQTQLAQQQQTLKQQQDFFAHQLSTNYILSRQGQWSLYFSGQSANDIQRYLTYYQAVNKAGIDTILQIQTTINQLKTTATEIQKNTRHLQVLYTKLKQQQEATRSQQHQRQKVLKKINTTIKNNQKALQTLKANQSNLTHLVDHLKTTKTNQKFSEMKHKLPWPIHGKVVHHFGQKMTESNLNWSGNLIAADQGTNVKAIFNGKVIYADWLRGYGLLIIIDHGDGFMSLYGRNHSLYKKVGDTVTMGETIATVGRSGGFQTPALYLELRHKGAPLNPKYWLK